MENLKLKIEKYYGNYDEDSRLIKDKSHSIEFITTIEYLKKYISKEYKILEVGAATGRYSFHYAQKGCQVIALEISQKHVEIMKTKAQNTDFDIEIVEGNALDLNEFKDEVFDTVLCLGPIYHLCEDERKKCIKECGRVLKPNGIIAVAYISKFSQFVDLVNRDRENIKDIGLQNILKTGCEYGDERDCFYFSTYEKIEKLMNENEISKLNHIGTDGIGNILRKTVNEFNEEEFELWLKYHLQTCENPNIIGYSEHCLYIGRKV